MVMSIKTYLQKQVTDQIFQDWSDLTIGCND